jgi:outer membrane protein OmpA-like peptidoglycan-associated protein
MTWAPKYLLTLPVGLSTLVGVVAVLIVVTWPRGRGFRVWALRVGAIALSLLGAAAAITAYHAAVVRQDVDATRNAELSNNLAAARSELSNTLAENRVQEARLMTLERTASEQKQIDAQRAADLEADLQKAMQDIGAMFSERNGVIELVLKDAVVHFDTDASTLQCDSKEKLSRVVGAISRVLDAVNSITIVGHTDFRGTADHNKTLSKHRADAVLKYLADSGIPRKMMNGVGKSYVQPAGYDAEQSVAVIKKANDTDKAMAENRRVQLLIRRKGTQP